MEWSHEIEHIAEFVKGRLYFAATFSERVEAIKNTSDIYYFNVDEEFVYLNYYMDFGPLNISCLYRYCLKLHAFMQCAQLKRIVHYTCADPEKRVNAAYLFGSYCVVYLSMDPKTVYKRLLEAGGAYKMFVDASQGISKYTLKLVECLQGVHKAFILNFINFEDFGAAEYDLYNKIQNGDFNWLVPRKFLALIGPIDKEVCQNGHAPSFYVKYFLKNDVRTVIRLNNKLYDPFVFLNAGISHYDLFFPDGTTPPKHILVKFLEIAENTSGAIAVHCKAGLGRTGSLIGAYIMKHYSFSAKEAIAWMRMCRPGCVIGQQQFWLEKIEPWLWKEGRQYRQSQYGDGDKLPHHKFGIYSKIWQQNRKKYLNSMQKRNLAEDPNRNLTDPGVHLAQVHQSSKPTLYNKENILPRRSNAGYVDFKTQGDKLNEIKMRKRHDSYVSNVSNIGTEHQSPNMTSNDNNLVYLPIRTSPFRTAVSHPGRHHGKVHETGHNPMYTQGNHVGMAHANRHNGYMKFRLNDWG